MTGQPNRANPGQLQFFLSVRYHDGKTIFLDHVLRLGKYVRLQKRKIPIVWDDMFRYEWISIVRIVASVPQDMSRCFRVLSLWYLPTFVEIAKHDN